MSDKTKIEWTDASWNPIRGCSLASEGCRNCYAMHVASRFNGPGMPYEGLTMKTSQGPKWTGKIMLVPDMLDQPVKWQRPRRIFVNSMSDLFHDNVPFEYVAAVFGVMAGASQHTYQVLTKRSERMLAFFKWIEEHPMRKHFDCDALRAKFPGVDWQPFMLAQMTADALPVDPPRGPYRVNIVGQWPLPNVWLGVSVENQDTANERIPLLRQTPAAVRWLSMEPLIGPVSLSQVSRGGTGPEGNIDWVVVGGESGPNARPMHPQWAEILQQQCKEAGVGFFFKQWGEWAPRQAIPSDIALPLSKWGWINVNGGPVDQTLGPLKDARAHHELVARIGKKAAGRLLDGRTWDEFPGVRS